MIGMKKVGSGQPAKRQQKVGSGLFEEDNKEKFFAAVAEEASIPATEKKPFAFSKMVAPVMDDEDNDDTLVGETEEEHVSQQGETQVQSVEGETKFVDAETDEIVLKFEPEQKEYSILERLRDVIDEYRNSDSGVFADTAKLRYCDGVSEAVIEDGELHLPIRKVYVGGKEVPFNSVGEVRIPPTTEIELDLGVSMVLPDGINLELSEISGVETKFGLSLKSKCILNRQDALFPIVVVMRPVDEVAYVNRYRSLIKARFVAV